MLSAGRRCRGSMLWLPQGTGPPTPKQAGAGFAVQDVGLLGPLAWKDSTLALRGLGWMRRQKTCHQHQSKLVSMLACLMWVQRVKPPVRLRIVVNLQQMRRAVLIARAA